MKKKRNRILLLAVIVFCISVTKQTISQPTNRSFNSAFENTFQKSHTISLNINEKVYLGGAVSIFKVDDRIFWGEKKRVSYFNENASFEESKNIEGRGPGEVLNAVDYSYNLDGFISILDLSLQKIKVYDKDLNFVREFTLDRNRSSKITSDGKGYTYTLNELLFDQTTSAISEYDSLGNKVGEWGNIPKSARVQRPNENGGGITTDDKGNVYYSYQGSHKIWKFNVSKKSVVVYDKKPPYFNPVAQDKVDGTRSAKKLFYLGYEGTRVTDLYFLEPDIIIQEMELGNPFGSPKEGLTYYLEIWNTDGEKLASKLQIPFPIAWTKGDSIAIFKQYSTGLLKENGNTEAFDIFKYNSGN